MNNFRIIIVLFFFFTTVKTVKGQDNRSLVELEKQRIHSFLTENIMEKTVDSTTIYSFAFRVEVKKDKFGKPRVVGITSNDSIARTLYPNYEQYFKKVNYSLFTKNTEKEKFVFPVIFLILSDKGSTCDFTIGNLTKKFLSAFYFDREKSNSIEGNTYFGPAIITMGKNIVK